MSKHNYKQLRTVKSDPHPYYIQTAKYYLIVWLCVLSDTTLGERNETIHPYLLCDPTPSWHLCPINHFCTFDQDDITESRCGTCPSNPLKNCNELELSNDAIKECQSRCIRSEENEICSRQGGHFSNNNCIEGDYFCNYKDGDTGVCQKCDNMTPLECLRNDDGGIFSDRGKEDCMMCELECHPIGTQQTAIDGVSLHSAGLSGSPDSSGYGPLVDCTNLSFGNDEVCEGAMNSICLVEDVNRHMYFHEAINQCEASGGVGIIFFGDLDYVENDKPCHGSLFDKKTNIPSVCISYNDGKQLASEKLGAMTNVSTNLLQTVCWKDYYCSDTIPCIGEYGDGYCGYEFGDKGWCWHCPVDEKNNPDPKQCFFGSVGGKENHKTQNAMKSCAASCSGSVTFDSCKFCPHDIDIGSIQFGVENESDRCYFCPDNDVMLPDREVPLFGTEITCWQMQSFFLEAQIHVDSKTCRLAQMMNYICGCKGAGYGGAATPTHKRLLVWLPRLMAIFSIIGSSFIICDIYKSEDKRKLIKHQLMVALSVFDILGAFAYALTSLPLPTEDYIFGSQGNAATCTAQGFFIQLGTISCYINVSLSIYFYLVIKLNWGETKIERKRIWFLICPIATGLIFAFAGIPFYDNMILWCNNSASWWPDIPVAIAILGATAMMGRLLWFVHGREIKAAKWRPGGNLSTAEETPNSDSYTNKVFWICFWYLMAFYITWIPYLALQYAWASGKAFSSYSFILLAGSMVPLQGFWNSLVYIRREYLKRSTRHNLSQFLSRSFSSISLKNLSRSFRRKSTELESVDGSNVQKAVELPPIEDNFVENTKENTPSSSFSSALTNLNFIQVNSSNRKTESEKNPNTVSSNENDCKNSQDHNVDDQHHINTLPQNESRGSRLASTFKKLKNNMTMIQKKEKTRQHDNEIDNEKCIYENMEEPQLNPDLDINDLSRSTIGSNRKLSKSDLSLGLGSSKNPSNFSLWSFEP